QAAINALPQLGPNDQVGLWMFSTNQDGGKDYRELVPMGRNNRDLLKKRIQGLIPGGGTGLYDTTRAAYRTVLERHSNDVINAVVVLTDGKNEDDNSISLEDLLAELRTETGQETVRVFTIAYGNDADLEVLRQISQVTDAAAYDSREPGSIDQVFTAVLSRSEEHTSELQSRENLVCRLLLEKKKQRPTRKIFNPSSVQSSLVTKRVGMVYSESPGNRGRTEDTKAGMRQKVESSGLDLR